ncbi:hypothetical protein VKT23_013119 [Stygiomarasmius scandens]|uniref:Uncharacterized protein n=1 Tax=Marasmiellus scandens TaxID=2682957 RepID=A0ABR1J417_9AGAR
MSKALSNGTLSLRFMQNAQRAQQQKEIELEKAQVEDDGRWEIAQEVRDSWGPTSQSSDSVSYETSYLPFLFPSLPEPDSFASDLKPKGRRTFKKGKEVITQTEPEQPAADTSESTSSTQIEPARTKKGKKIANSSFLSSGPNDRIAQNVKSERPISKSNKIAKLAIFDTSGVGTDLRSNTTLTSVSSDATAQTTFMKPAGVDDPKGTLDRQVISGAREVKTKRVRKTTSGPNEDVKPKKRKIAVE